VLLAINVVFEAYWPKAHIDVWAAMPTYTFCVVFQSLRAILCTQKNTQTGAFNAIQRQLPMMTNLRTMTYFLVMIPLVLMTILSTIPLQQMTVHSLPQAKTMVVLLLVSVLLSSGLP
jgi:hypothetical protein